MNDQSVKNKTIENQKQTSFQKFSLENEKRF